MKTFVLLAFAVLISWLPMTSNAGTDPVVVPTVDFSRYSGLWYEIGHSPNFFQRFCERSTAEYAVVSATQVSVLNTCYRGNAVFSTINGVATVTNPREPAKLIVDFGWFRKGAYWIIALDKDYQWAVVSGPKKSSLFILARTAPMDRRLLASILKELAAQGFDTNNIVWDKY